MPALTLYKLKDRMEGAQVAGFEDYLAPDKNVDPYGPTEAEGFTAKLYVTTTPPRPPRWLPFLREGFGDEVQIPSRRSLGALVIVQIQFGNRPHYFALPFGPSGRFLLNDAAIQRAYGLRTALNLIYPADVSEEETSRLVSIDAKRRGENTIRSRVQSSRATTFETFDVDRLRDVLDAATGRPAGADRWGQRITGADAVSLGVDLDFAQLGLLCRRLEQAHRRSDYRQRFAWLDNIQPVADPDLVGALEEEVVNRIRGEELDDLDLSPPQIVEWSQVDDFKYAVQRPQNLRHPDLRLHEYVAALKSSDMLENLTPAQLRHTTISARDANADAIHIWTAWKCLTGTHEFKNQTYVLDEGEFFVVATDFLEELNDFIATLPDGLESMPTFQIGWDEKRYNEEAAKASESRLLLDRDTIRTSATTTAVEVCDLLTQGHELIHVKRELGSRDLSHLFSQGVVSAELIQTDKEFRKVLQSKVKERSGNQNFAFFDENGITTSEFQVTYAVIAHWRKRTAAEALPFFSKVNLRRTAVDLTNRGFHIGFQQIESPHPGKKKKTTKKHT